MRSTVFAAALAASAFAGTAFGSAQAQTHAVIFNNAIADGGFNQMANDGLQRFKRESGTDPRTGVIANPEQSAQRMEAFVRAGTDHILLNGFINEAPVKEIAAKFPNVKFTLIDGAVDLPNVASVQFAEDEAGFLAGVAAASLPGVDKIAAVGAMPIPPIQRFMSGYCQGAKAVTAALPVEFRFIGNQPAVFRDRAGAARITVALLEGGADVVFGVAGPAGAGVLEAAANAGKYAVGVDVNENASQPGKVVTSAMKRVDVATYEMLTAVQKGTWKAGVQRLGLGQGAVGWARDEHNAALVAPFAARVEAMESRIRTGELKLQPFNDAGACTVTN